jgi:hypothetical protein
VAAVPDSGRSKRWWFLLGMIGSLSAVVIFLSIVGFGLRNRVDSLEADRNQEKLATRTAEVATCYLQARSRPRLIVILRLLSATAERDPVGRTAVNDYIREYQMSTPTMKECNKKARELGFAPEDFPPQNSR